jgi:ADP-ribose pyrophosphatase YjhB (NUDIX family)
MSPFTLQDNPFNGTQVSLTETDVTLEHITSLLADLNAKKRALVWVTVPIHQAKWIPLFTSSGFVFHLCEDASVTLVCRLQPDAYAPFSPTHTLGVGGLVENKEGKVLLIRDRWMNGKGFKLPGGYMDLGENFHTAAEREVAEETGIVATFDSIVSAVAKHPHAYNKSNIYVVCRLTPQTELINIQDPDEIEHAEWVEPDDFINDEDSSRFHRHLVATLRHVQGLKPDAFDFGDILHETSKAMYSMGNND